VLQGILLSTPVMQVRFGSWPRNFTQELILFPPKISKPSPANIVQMPPVSLSHMCKSMAEVTIKMIRERRRISISSTLWASLIRPQISTTGTPATYLSIARLICLLTRVVTAPAAHLLILPTLKQLPTRTSVSVCVQFCVITTRV
jgi:hypothetical protein